jgi:hypothetical protein
VDYEGIVRPVDYEGIVRPVFYQIYIFYYWNLQFLNNVIIIKTKAIITDKQLTDLLGRPDV